MDPKMKGEDSLEQLLKLASGLTNTSGNPRLKQIVHRILSDLFNTIEDLDVTPEEFWVGVAYLNDLGAAGEAGLLAPGVGLEHFLDLRMDAKDASASLQSGTPRTIEGPLYIPDAPLFASSCRLDDGCDRGETLIMHGTVRSTEGKPIVGAIVDVWHANSKGFYSGFDASQSKYNLRRRIQTEADGKYRFHTIMPSGYACPPEGPTQAFLNAIGRHGRRPAHIHFFISAPEYRHLTTQINISGDPYLYDDFAFATREGLIPGVVKRTDEESMRREDVEEPFFEIEFDFALSHSHGDRDSVPTDRRHLLLT
jgi:catechol 1,2-dioxygenase